MKIKDKEKIASNLKEAIKKDKAHTAIKPSTNNSSANHGPSLKLLFTVIESSYSNELTQLLNNAGVSFSFVLRGRGTANSQLLNLLGLGDSSRDIILTVVETDKASTIIEHIYEACRTTGVIFSVRLSSVGGRRVLNFLQGGSNNVSTN